MPTTTLWRAMRSERRPIRMACGDAVDAVDGDHGVGGLGGDGRALAGHRDADVGERERRRVVDAVADHHDRPGRLGAHALDDRELVAPGVCSA